MASLAVMPLPFTLTLSDLADPVLIIGVAFCVAYWLLERADAREWREKRRRGFDVTRPPDNALASHADQSPRKG